MNAKASNVQERIRDDRERAQKWFSRHLWEKTGVDIQAVVTTPVERIRRICEVIAKNELADKVMGRFNGREEKYKTWVLRALGIDLDA